MKSLSDPSSGQSWELSRRTSEADGPGAAVEPPVPDRHDQLLVFERKSAGKMHSIGPTQTVLGRELAGMTLDRTAQLDRPHRGPILLEGPFGGDNIGRTEVVVPLCCGECRPYFGGTQVD